MALPFLVAGLPHLGSAQITRSGAVGGSNPFSSPTWDAGDVAVVGDSVSDGRLTINSGGTVVVSGMLLVGVGQGLSGVIDVNGGTLNAGPLFFLGNPGSATLIVRNGGTVTLPFDPAAVAPDSIQSFLSAEAGAGTSILIQVTGGTLSTGEKFDLVGDSSKAATLEISGASLVTSWEAELENAEAYVSGGKWNVSKSLAVHNLLDISANGSVAAASFYNSGRLVIRDSGALSGSNLNVGGVEISGNGSMSASTQVAFRSGNVSGSGSIHTGTLLVTGEMMVQESATVSANDGSINAFASLDLSGNASLEVAQKFDASGKLVIRDSAVMSVSQLVVSGQLTEVNGGSVDAGNIVVGGSRTGTLTISDGQVTAGGVYLGYGGTSKGTLQLNGGVLTTTTVWGAATGGFGGGGPGVVRFNGGTLRLSQAGANLFSNIKLGDVTLEAGGGTIDTQGFDVSTASEGLDGPGRLTKKGEGRLTLGGANTYAGGTAVSAGTLSVTGSIYHPDAELWVSGPTAVLGISGNGSVTNSDASIVGGEVRVSGGRWTNTGSIAVGGLVPGHLTISGGEVTATEVSTGYAFFDTAEPSTITLTGGVLTTGQVVRAAPRPATVSFGGGTLRLSGHQSDLFSGFAPGSVTLDSGGGTIDTQGFDVTTAQGLGGVGGLVKKGGGTLTLTGENTYTGGTTITEGGLMIGDGATGSITGDVVNHGLLWFNRTGTHTFEGVISGTGLVISVGGTLIQTGNHQYTGGTIAGGGGTIQLGNGGSTGSVVGDISLGGGIFGTGHLIANRSDEFTLSGVISGVGTLTQAGTGTLTLTGGNTYTGATSVNAGTLLVDGSITSDVTVQSGATFGGGGTVYGQITLESGSALRPLGELKTEILEWNSGGTLILRLGGETSDSIDMDYFTGGGEGTFAFTFENADWQVGQTYTLLAFGHSTFTGTNFTFTNGGGFAGTFLPGEHSLQFKLTAVPEPQAWSLVLVGLIGTLAVLRRRSK